MIKQILSSGTSQLPDFDAQTRQLLIEISSTELIVVLWNLQIKQAEAVEVYQGIHNCVEDIPTIFAQSTLLVRKQLVARVVWSTPRMLPVPTPFFQPALAKQHMEDLFGNANGWVYKGDLLLDDDMVLNWQADEDCMALLGLHFEVMHSKCMGALVLAQLKHWPNPPETAYAGQLIFSGANAFFAVRKAKQLLFLRSFPAGTPEDISYHTLHFCQIFNIDPIEITLKLSGLFTTDSPLWEAIDRYFPNLIADTWDMPLLADIPGHYFSHLYKNAE